jgi:phosphopantothenoylcysteine synthetase/decarboxylase
MLPFSTIYMYLNGIIEIKKHLPTKSTIILAGAVSDFIPLELPTHKMTTTNNINLELCSVPKILGDMTDPEMLCVSFKLETDVEKIKERILFALDKYQVDLVVGNMLGNKKWVHIHYNQNRFKGLIDRFDV